MMERREFMAAARFEMVPYQEPTKDQPVIVMSKENWVALDEKVMDEFKSKGLVVLDITDDSAVGHSCGQRVDFVKEVQREHSMMEHSMTKGGQVKTVSFKTDTTEDNRLTQPIVKRMADAEGHKVGRNQQCPCGSGKKFKVCCLVNRYVEPSEKSSAEVSEENKDGWVKPEPQLLEGFNLTREGLTSIKPEPQLSKRGLAAMISACAIMYERGVK